MLFPRRSVAGTTPSHGSPPVWPTPYSTDNPIAPADGTFPRGSVAADVETEHEHEGLGREARPQDRLRRDTDDHGAAPSAAFTAALNDVPSPQVGMRVPMYGFAMPELACSQ
jgi:hypothetical protein